MSLNKNVKKFKVVFIVHLLEGVEFVVKSVSICDDPRIYIFLENTLESPITVYKSHVPQLVVLLHADWATELYNFILKFKNPVAAIYNKKTAVGLTVLVQAVAEPTQAVSNFAVPGTGSLPANFLNISKVVEVKVHANRDLLAHFELDHRRNFELFWLLLTCNVLL